MCWGRGTEAQLGNGIASDAWTLRAVSDGDPVLPTALAQIGTGATHACGPTTARAIYCWGDGVYGQLGAGDIHYSVIAVRVAAAR